MEEFRDADDHFSEGQDHEQEHPLRKMREIDGALFVIAVLKGPCGIAKEKRGRGQDGAEECLDRDREENDSRLGAFDKNVIAQNFPVQLIQLRPSLSLVPVSVGEIQKN